MSNYHIIRSQSLDNEIYQRFINYLKENPPTQAFHIVYDKFICPAINFQPEYEAELANELGPLYPEFQLRIWAKTIEDNCSDYRRDFAIPDEDGMILISGEEYNQEMWIYGSFYDSVPNYFLHTDMWKAFGMKDENNPLEFQIASTYLANAIQNPGQLRYL